VWLLCGVAVALACGPRAQSSEAPRADSAASTSRKSRADTSRAVATSLRAAVQGSTVALSFHVTNVRDAKLELSFPSGQTHDFAVLDPAGREIWRWSRDRMFTQAVQSKFLDAKETVTYEERWDAAGQRGTFTVVASLTSRSHPVTERIELTLP
jgi:hypothetical protein